MPRHGDGYHGHPQNGPYDRIIVTCGIAGIPPHWFDQLVPGGVILAPLAHAGVHPIFAVHRLDRGQVEARVALWADFMPAAGPLRPTALFHHDPATDLPSDRLRPVAGVDIPLDTAQYRDLWFYLGTQEPRITRAYLANEAFDPTRGVCALVDPTDGAAWIHQDGGITLAGESHLYTRLVNLVARWQAIGRPAAVEWAARLEHTEDATLLLPRWHP